MNIIFLDIDGVLNSDKFSKTLINNEVFPFHMEIDPKALNNLTNLLKDNSLIQIVISSSWRDSLSLEDFKTIFDPFQDRVIDMIHIHSKKEIGIELWIKTNKPSKFIILDDDTLFDLEHPYSKNQLKTNMTFGLEDKHIEYMSKYFKE